MITTDSSVGRWYQLIQDGKKIPGKENTAAALAKLFDISVKDRASVMLKMSKLLSLPNQVRTEVSMLDNVSPELLLKWLPKAEASLFSLSLASPWSSFVGAYDAEVIYGMEFCGDALSRQRPDATLPGEKLRELQDQINALYSQLEDDELDPYLKEFIYTHLKEIRQAIDDYRILGITPIEASTQRVIGSVATSPLAAHAMRTGNSFPVMSKFWSIVNALVLLTNLAVNFQVLTHDPDDSETVHIEHNNTEIIINPRPTDDDEEQDSSKGYSLLLPSTENRGLDEA